MSSERTWPNLNGTNLLAFFKIKTGSIPRSSTKMGNKQALNSLISYFALLNPKKGNVCSIFQRDPANYLGDLFCIFENCVDVLSESSSRQYSSNSILCASAKLILNLAKICKFAQYCSFNLQKFHFFVHFTLCGEVFWNINEECHQIKRVIFAEEFRIFYKIRYYWNIKWDTVSDHCCKFCSFEFFILNKNWLEIKNCNILK